VRKIRSTLNRLARFALGVFAILISTSLLSAQQVVQSPAAATPESGVASVPPVKGINFLLSSSSQFDDANGWSSVLSPVLSYRFSHYFSLSTGVPAYLDVNAQKVKGTVAAPVYYSITGHGVVGDMTAAGEFDYDSSWLGYTFTATGAFPTGNSTYNLTANAKTYNVNNHFEHSIGIFTPDIEIGEGNSSSLSGTHVRRAYVAVGPLANFQAGTSIDLPRTMRLEVEAYESMPLGNQNVYGTVKTKKGKTKTVLEGTGVAEDNGFNTTFSIQPNPHFGVTAFYNRSLRQYDNTTGFSLTYPMRAPKPLVAR
jgi:hypothetical protein